MEGKRCSRIYTSFAGINYSNNVRSLLISYLILSAIKSFCGMFLLTTYKRRRFMSVLSTKVHGILDYTVGAIMIAAPWLFGFAENRNPDQTTGYGAETWVFVILGVAAILYSLLTNYELGVWKSISMKTHLTFDTLSGIFLALSPWILGFSNIIFLPHLIFGIVEIVVVILTDPQPYHGPNFAGGKFTGNMSNVG